MLKRIFITAGEVSGDMLGADLVRELKRCHPDAIIEGVAGPRMIAAGCTPLFPMDTLAVMGIAEVIRHLPSIFRLKRQLLKHCKINPPDIYIGVDAPDFNLRIEKSLKVRGIPTVHYNSPTVWAWREKRLNKIAKSTDLMLTLFPFEEQFYRERKLNAAYVGHPMADAIPLAIDKVQGKLELQLDSSRPVLAILPGSREKEIHYLANDFILAAKQCLAAKPDLQLIVPLVNPKRRAQFEAILQDTAPELPVTLYDGQARHVLIAADVALIASGTATLEAMLCKTPMVMAYRLAPLTYQIGKRLIKVDKFALPNILAGRELVPEFIQDAVTIDALTEAVLAQFHRTAECIVEFTQLHQQLQCDASVEAVKAVDDFYQTTLKTN
ncbi:MAG: lipid-A-disaccharide synthase [Legionellales bacterium]|nr:lipid-A-disaccharide synthase [Legionellales bacterium]|tara:strand:+ start:65414 stop:66559 length:1146 start_codon:yes stop_codon:yes gene_type:complete